MSNQSHDLLNAALLLPEADRADLAASLLRSLDSSDDPDADLLWAVEIERRLKAIDKDDVKLVPWDDVMATMRKRRDG